MQELGVTRKQGRHRRAIAVVLTVLATATAAFAVASPSGAQTSGDSTGVTDKAIKIGYLYSEGGVAGSTFAHADDGFNARIKAQNAAGGVNGRKIDAVLVDDSGSQNNLQAAKALLENDDVFAVVNNSSFAFLSYRYLLE